MGERARGNKGEGVSGGGDECDSGKRGQWQEQEAVIMELGLSRSVRK